MSPRQNNIDLSDLEARRTFILSKFGTIEKKVMEAKAKWTSFHPFGDVIIKYKDRFQESFNQPRRIPQIEQIKMAETHWFMDLTLLDRWMSNVRIQESITQTMNQVEGAAIAILDKYDVLNKELENNDRKCDCVLVLFVPSPDKWCDKVMKAMESCKDPFMDLDESPDENWYNPTAWYADEANQKLVVDKLRELADHVKENIDQVKLYIKLTDDDKDFSCHYFIYNASSELVKGELGRLPAPPKVTINSTMVSGTQIRLHYEACGYPITFIVQLRRHLTENWKENKINHSIIFFRPGPAMELRVATHTCVGRSKFSPIFFVPELLKQAEPVVTTLTHSTANLEWPLLSTNRSVFYQIRYKETHLAGNFAQLDVGIQNYWRLKELNPETTYSVNVAAVFPGAEDEIRCAPSESIQFTTLKKRFASKLVERCKKMGSRNDLDLYVVPLSKVAESAASTTIEQYMFSEANDDSSPGVLHKTIMLLGPTDKSKTTLINAMINYIFDVNWKDEFRFQLIEDQVDTQQQTSRVKVYTIRHAEGFRIPYSVTIVDVVEDAKFLEESPGPEMIRKVLIDSEIGIKEVDFVSLVFQPSDFNSVLSQFGKEVKENCNFIMTSEALCLPKEFENFHRHNIKSEDFFQSNRLTDSSSWDDVQKNFEIFFNQLATMNSKSLLQTLSVLTDRKQCETTLDELQFLMFTKLAKMGEIRDALVNVKKIEEKINELEKESNNKKPDWQKVELPAGQYVTNCSKCRVVCFRSRYYASWGCTPACQLCSGKCDSAVHSTDNYVWKFIPLPVDRLEEINRKLEAERRALQVARGRVAKLEKDHGDIVTMYVERVHVLSKVLNNLHELAICRAPYTLAPTIAQKINAEIEKKQLGLSEIDVLRKRCFRAEIINAYCCSEPSLLALVDSESNVSV